MKHIPISILLIFATVYLAAQEEELSRSLASTITTIELKQHVEHLASDSMGGRGTGQSGNLKAAAYIAHQFKNFGISPLNIASISSGHFQNVPFDYQKWEKVSLRIDDMRFVHLQDFMVPPVISDDSLFIKTDDIVFLGHGIKMDDFDNYDNLNTDDLPPIGIIYSNSPEGYKDWPEEVSFNQKRKWAAEAGIEVLMVVETDLDKILANARHYYEQPVIRLANEESGKDLPTVVFISEKIFNELITKDRKLRRYNRKIEKDRVGRSFSFRNDIELRLKKERYTFQSPNVLGYIEGIDPILKDEVVVVTAHYDHLGKIGEEIYYGADDNASGTAVVMEVAEALAIASQQEKGPKRSVLCMLVTGEEKGLLGSRYYTENPIFALDNTIANVNIDMVGRVDEAHEDNPKYIYVIGSDRLSQDLDDIVKEQNQLYSGLELDYTYNAEDDPNRYYYRSDHYNFAVNNIPSVFFFSGVHEDYHKPTDTMDKIMYDKMLPVSRYIFHVIWELANRAEKPQLNQ